MKYLEKTFKIPSNGAFGGPKKATLREMTTREEKILLGTKDFSVFERIVKSCCVDEDLNFDLLHTSDIMYLTFMLRELTYGPDYLQENVCPNCGHKSEIQVDINEMEVEVLSDEQAKKLSEGVIVELSTGDKLTVNMLCIGQSKHIDKIVKTKMKQNRLKDPQGYEMMLRLAMSVSLIETKEPSEVDYENVENKIEYLNQLRMKDLVTIQNALNDFDFGLRRNIYRECENCGEDMEVTGFIVPEFFHPSK